MHLENFNGVQYRLADNWYKAVDVNTYSNKPIKYLEIGTFYGANILSVAKSYAAHPQSELHCIDPWEDYAEYPEYKTMQTSIFSAFSANLAASPNRERIHVHRGYSHAEIPKFDDASFDIVYVDGNHESEYVLEDAVLAFRKLKVGGVLIFDDYGWGGPDLTQKGIDAFLAGYHKRIQIIPQSPINTQYFIRKTS